MGQCSVPISAPIINSCQFAAKGGRGEERIFVSPSRRRMLTVAHTVACIGAIMTKTATLFVASPSAFVAQAAVV